MTVATSTYVGQQSTLRGGFRIALPPADISLCQDQEWCVVRLNGAWREIRLHDYDQLFAVPGLYERLVYDILKCDSPARIRKLLEAELAAAGVRPGVLRALDFGAGNGMVGEELATMGVELIVGVDIEPAAERATRRDRPSVYANYRVVDMTCLDSRDRQALSAYRFNCLTCVAALGFGDIPVRAFAGAFNLVETGGWVAFNIKAAFLDENDTSGFGRFIRSMMADKTLEVRNTQRYQHRIGTDRKPIHYLAIVANKGRDVADDLLV